jgi:putative hemin transport protein
MNPLLSSWQSYRLAHPQSRALDAATALGVSEGALVASALGVDSHDLGDDFGAIVQDLREVGTVMCLTRNRSVVHERYGRFEKVEVGPSMGGVYGPDIDLRLFWSRWARAYASPVPTRTGTRRSLQFFDGAGLAVLKVYATDDTDLAAWESLIARRAVAPRAFVPSPPPAPTPEVPDDQLDQAGLRAAWHGLTDTHEFFGLLRRFSAGREQALRLGPPEFVRQAALASLERTLRRAADAEERIMVFVGNPGCVQIHSGVVRRIAPTGSWLNVLDPSFNLHVDQTRLRSAWWVRKPTAYGPVDSLEVFDTAGDLVVQLFGKRSDTEPLRESWRELLGEAVASAGAA